MKSVFVEYPFKKDILLMQLDIFFINDIKNIIISYLYDSEMIFISNSYYIVDNFTFEIYVTNNKVKSLFIK